MSFPLKMSSTPMAPTIILQAARNTVCALFEVEAPLQAVALLGGQRLPVEHGEQPARARRHRAIAAAGQEIRRRLVEQGARVVAAQPGTRLVAVAEAGLPVEVGAPEDERPLPADGFLQLEAVHHPLPPEEGRARRAQVPDQRIGADGG